MSVAVPAARLVGELGKVVEASGGPELVGGLVPHEVHFNSQVLVHRDVGPQRSEVFGPDPDEVAGPAVPRRCAEDLGRILEHR